MRRTLPIAAFAVLATLVLIVSAAAQAPIQRAPGVMSAPMTTLAPPSRFAPLALSARQTMGLRSMRAAAGLNFNCNPVVCVCRGDLDCNDMFETNVCGTRAICIGSYCYCDRPTARMVP